MATSRTTRPGLGALRYDFHPPTGEKGQLMLNYQIRPEACADHDAITAVIRAAFAQQPYASHHEHELVERLRDSGDYVAQLTLVAEHEGEIIGHIMFSTARVANTTILALAPLAVLPAYQGQGVGSSLVQTAHRIGGDLEYPLSVVLGSPTYYRRFGYVPASQFGLQAPFPVEEGYYQACPLYQPLPPLSGSVIYPAAFLINATPPTNTEQPAQPPEA